MAQLLDQISKARRISLELQNVDYASELSGGLKKFAIDMEKKYLELQKLVTCKKPDPKALTTMLRQLAAKSQWFEKAEASS